MLALKKKREAEAKKAAEAAESASANGSESPGPEKVSLLGIGGKKTTRNGDSAKTGAKKRTPGEIRIQKGAVFAAMSVGWMRSSETSHRSADS
jgi:hypothetical protein